MLGLPMTTFEVVDTENIGNLDSNLKTDQGIITIGITFQIFQYSLKICNKIIKYSSIF